MSILEKEDGAISVINGIASNGARAKMVCALAGLLVGKYGRLAVDVPMEELKDATRRPAGRKAPLWLVSSVI